ncbi:MAG: radical SAM protein [Candidatus Omnitrophica bacterium]|nr:radical SAM protein [Candidatus Omnitrophota bacterium]MBU1929259.1 radical SAM protein [Candidatus Omnitrophota bacterium]MBU2034964.1 radical SAM protein [Candidatus Omnitrophota bacterium]
MSSINEIELSKSLGDVIRETIGTCSLCSKKVKANIVEIGGKIMMYKYCSEHGCTTVLISNHPWYYKALTDFYFGVMPKIMKQSRFYIYLSNRCNLDCPICLLEPNQKHVPDITLERFEKTLKKQKRSRFYLYGAEPTLRDDIEDWIRLLKRYGNTVNMHTNGIKLADLEFLKKLKSCGIDYISLQFDGFSDDVYMKLRNRKLAELKLQVLNNLRKLNIPTGLNVTIAKGVNEEQVPLIINYAAVNNFIKDVSFATVSFIGNANSNFQSGSLLMPDELIDIVELHTKGKISRKNVYFFQKLYYTLLSALKIRRCYNFQQLALVRDKGRGYISFDELFRLDSLEKKLDKYRKFLNAGNKLAVFYLFYILGLNMFGKNAMAKLRCIPLGMPLPGSILNARIPPRILLLSFGTVCDFYKFDSQISKYCGQGVCFEDKGNIVLTDTISDLTLFYGKENHR